MTRDDQIRAAAATGAAQHHIGRQFGLGQQRISQIVRGDGRKREEEIAVTCARLGVSRPTYYKAAREDRLIVEAGRVVGLRPPTGKAGRPRKER